MNHVKHSAVLEFPDLINNLVEGDCVQVLKTVPDNSIDLVVTSPPYFVNKSYETDWTFDKYESLMSSVFQEVYRVLIPGRYFVVNFGDYFNNGRLCKTEVPGVFPASVNYFKWGQGTGFDLQSTRIWRKKFSRMGIPFVCNSHPRHVFDYEHVWTYRKPSGDNTEFVNDRKKSQKGVIGEEWTSSADLHHHEAAFPIELPLWAIDVYSKREGEIVLDPFAGICTTLLAAKERDRLFIGIELDPKNCMIGHRRFNSPVKIKSTKNVVGSNRRMNELQ